MGFGLFHPIAFASISNNTPKEKLGNVMGKFTAIGDIGKFLITSLFTIILAYVDYKLTIIYFSIPLLLGVFMVALIKEKEMHTKVKGAAFSFNLKLMRDPGYTKIIFLQVCDNFASFSMMNFLPFLFLSKSLDKSILGYMVGVFFMGSIIGKLYLGRISDKYDSKKVFIVSELIMAILILVLILGSNLYLIIFALVLIGIVTKGTTPVLVSMLGKHVSEKTNKEEYFGLNAFFTQIALTLSPWFYGVVGDLTNINFVFIAMLLFALFGVFIAMLNPRGLKV